MDLKGKSAIVTGASLGIGLAIASALIDRGVRVAGIARNAARLRSVSAKLGEAFYPLPCDVGNFDQVRTAVKAARGALKTLDILINDAGIGRFGAIDQLAIEDWNEMLATNLSGPYHCIHEVVPVMKAQGSGHIVNVASIAGIVGYANAAGYNATKFAVRGLSAALVSELGEFGIKVSAIYPGATDTTFGNGGPNPANPPMRPEDVAESVLHVLERSENVLITELVLRPCSGSGRSKS
jgi:NADP-dependent 3-hydroxy acid dehydrogenase YdfG